MTLTRGWLDLVRALDSKQRQAISVRQAIEAVWPRDPSQSTHKGVREAVQGLLRLQPFQTPSGRALGGLLRKNQDRVRDGLRIVSRGADRNGAALWGVDQT